MWERIIKRDFPDEWFSLDNPIEEYQSLHLQRVKEVQFKNIIKQYFRFEPICDNFEYNALMRFNCLRGEFVSLKHLPLVFNDDRQIWFKNHIQIDFINSTGFYLRIRLKLDMIHFSTIDEFLVGAKANNGMLFKFYPWVVYSLDIFSPHRFH